MSYFLKQHWLHCLSHNEHKPQFWHWLRTYELFVCYILKSAFVNGRSFPLLVSSFIWPLCTSIMHAQSLLKIIMQFRTFWGVMEGVVVILRHVWISAEKQLSYFVRVYGFYLIQKIWFLFYTLISILPLSLSNVPNSSALKPAYRPTSFPGSVTSDHDCTGKIMIIDILLGEIKPVLHPFACKKFNIEIHISVLNSHRKVLHSFLFVLRKIIC